VLRRSDGPLDDTVPAQHPITVRELLTFTWGFGMQGAMFIAPEPWPIFTATLDRELATFGPPHPGRMPDPDTWLARLGKPPLLAQPRDRWLYQTASQVLGVLASRLAGAPFDEVLRERVLGPLAMETPDSTRPTPLGSRPRTRTGMAGWEVSDAPDGQWSRPPRVPDDGGGLVSCVHDVVAFGQMCSAPTATS
jgi:CubicO group peptidase (beta-lactamase class C family)